MELVFDEAARMLSGTWKYPNGRHGPVTFGVSAECALESGRWADAGRTPQRPWTVTGRAVSKSTPSSSAGEPAARPRARAPAIDDSSKSPPARAAARPTRGELHITKEVYAPGEELEFRVETAAELSKVWLTLVRLGDASPGYFRRIRLGSANTVQYSLRGLPAGDYELRLFVSKVDEVVARRSFRIALPSIAEARPQGGAASARPEPPRPPESSRILELYDRPTGAAEGKHRLDLSGYRRPDMIGNIYEGKFELVPAAGLDNIRYYAQTVADLAARCPTLGLEAAKHQLLPFVISGMADLVRRFHTGELTQSEVMQMMWGGVVGLNQLRSCRYDPRRESRAEAQAQCDQAARDTARLGILPSDDASSDTTLFLDRHRCNSEAAVHLARQLIAFARVAHTRSHFPARMPSPASQEGKAYAAIFENCSRSSLDNRAHAWCGCYVRTLHSLKPADQILQALAQNPFVDASTYMLWVARNVTGGRAVYDCSTSTPGFDGWRDGYAPRTTACLIRETPVAGDARECRYRAASGVFTVTSDECKAEISSRLWGYREVDCQAGGGVAAARVGPREWRRGAFTAIDYEGEVDPTFVPPLPPDARAKTPLMVRLPKRDTPGLLKAMALTVLTNGHLVVLGMPLKLGQVTGTDIAAIDREGTLVLQCDYQGDKGVRVKMYWFEKTPKHVRDGKINPALQPYFAQIGEGSSSCPPRG